MKLLLDTHVWIQCIMDPRRLERHVTRALTRPGNEVCVSPISGLEFLSLCQRKSYRAIRDPAAWIRAAMSAPFREAPLTFEIAIECGLITLPHDDPADRILVATARVLGCTLVTSDQRIIESRLVAVL